MVTLWVLLSILDGVRDGFMYNVKDVNKENNPNEHIVFTIHRLSILLAVFSINHNWIELIACILLFPYFHDGAYYKTRNVLSNGRVYKNGWLDHSKNSTAITTKLMTPLVRITLAVVAFILLIYFKI